MNIEELRFIVGQQRESAFFYVFDEYWVTNEILAQALTEIDAVYRDRLGLLRGINRKDYAKLVMPKIGGGSMKPGLSNTCYGARRALWHLSRVLRRLGKQAKQEKPKELEQIKTRLSRVEEAIWGMNYDTAKHVVDSYIEATKQNPNIEASPSVLLAEKVLGV